jgi:hypothetical protein
MDEMLARSQNSVSLISSLVVDTLLIITRDLDIYEVSRLWMCGDLKLCASLSHGVMTKLRLENAWSTTPLFWPSIVSYLPQLTYLYFTSAGTNAGGCSKRHLNALPSTLTYLRLDVQNFANFFLFPSVVARFPNLTTLKLASNDALTWKQVQNLPKSLLTLKICIQDPTPLKDFPIPSLTSLNLRHLRQAHDKPLLFPSFPKMQSLKLKWGKHGLFDGCVVFLPATLTRLSTRLPKSTDSLNMMLAPLKHLQELEILSTPQNVEYQFVHLFVSLPRTLQVFIWREIPGSSVLANIHLRQNAIEALPPTLQRLSIPQISVDPSAISYLPPTLEQFDCNISQYVPPDVNFPNSLKRFSNGDMQIPLANFSNKNIEELVGVDITVDSGPITWPKNLKLLKAVAHRRSAYPRAPTDIHPTCRLPKTLFTLNLIVPELMPLSWLIPSQCLTDLTLYSEFNLFCGDNDGDGGNGSDVDWNKLFPQTLTRLKLSFSSSTFNLAWLEKLVPAIPNIEFLELKQVSFESSSMQLLPKSLKSLSIAFSKPITWEDTSLESFKKMRYLDLSRQLKFVMPPVERLPSRLTKMKVPFKTNHFAGDLYDLAHILIEVAAK